MPDIIKDDEYRKLLPSVSGRAFLFFGKEDYLKAAAVRNTREQLCENEALAVFNDVVIDATDYTPQKLLDTMAAPPMMSESKLILLRGMHLATMRTSDIDDLLATLEQLEEYDYNTVILTADADTVDEGRLPKAPSPMLKRLAKVFVPVWFDTPTDARLVKWVEKHFLHCGVTVTPQNATLLIERAGRNMFTLANEIEKLVAYVKENGKGEVSTGDVLSVSSITATPDVFAFSNALLAGNGKKALDALAIMKFERIEPGRIVGEIAATLANMQAAKILTESGKNIKEIAATLGIHEYKMGLIVRAVSGVSRERIARIVSLAAEADLAIKRSYADYSPIERLIGAL